MLCFCEGGRSDATNVQATETPASHQPPARQPAAIDKVGNDTAPTETDAAASPTPPQLPASPIIPPKNGTAGFDTPHSQATPLAHPSDTRTHNPMDARDHCLLSRHRSSGVPYRLVAIPPPYSPISAAPSGPPPHPQPIVAAVRRTLTILTGFFPKNEVRWCRKNLLH